MPKRNWLLSICMKGNREKDGGGVDPEGHHGKPLSGVPIRAVDKLGGSVLDKSKWTSKSLVTIALTLLTSSQAILIAWLRRAGKYDYSVTTANFLGFFSWLFSYHDLHESESCPQVYSTSVAMLLTAVVSVFLFGFHLSLAFFLGSTVVSLSIYLHSIGKVQR
ncbi:CMP-sialic acid transporter 2-like isoform X2 [Amborella trichopoda]|uniref:CMP-sialic acid transporter 2-like isoform X2 n=1 Tax=Amborella trichopoda TaxID=13333 RepID=UPI0009C00BC8|nr:CMP-sialic acid transporter 2-like isoform X2 [Amborella trichopoda]|eukprot:XP_020528062.1 CMP-sialic acid transporter 2-like isoform X2 [Amborella trichopoda]